jgi:hypothetical protein
MLVIDTALFEKQLFSMGHRGPMIDPQTGKARAPKTMISLATVFRSLSVDVQCTFHNSGNDAFFSLLALQLLLDKDNTRIPQMRGRATNMHSMASSGSRSPAPILAVPVPMATPYPMSPSPQLLPNALAANYSMNAYLDNDFGVAIRRSPGHSNSTSKRGGRGGGKGHSRQLSVDRLTGSMQNFRAV